MTATGRSLWGRYFLVIVGDVMFSRCCACICAGLLGVAGFAILGCGPDASRSTPGLASTAQQEATVAEGYGGGYAEEAGTDAVPAVASGKSATASALQNRKIIYTTWVELVVDEYQDFERRIVDLVEQHGGFVSNSDTDRRYNDQQSGRWTVRVPIDQYSQFLNGVTSLGFAESRKENAQDVTEEYVDIEARIKNKRELESRVIKMLEERTGKLADVLEIERELSRIREEIERMEGRLRYLADRTSLATVTINCREEQEYTPPEAPTFASRVSRSWQGSLDALITVGQHLLIALVAAVPWLVVASLPVAMGLVTYRRSRRR